MSTHLVLTFRSRAKSVVLCKNKTYKGMRLALWQSVYICKPCSRKSNDECQNWVHGVCPGTEIKIPFGKPTSGFGFPWQFLGFLSENPSIRVRPTFPPDLRLSIYLPISGFPVRNPAPKFGFMWLFLGVPEIRKPSNFKPCICPSLFSGTIWVGREKLAEISVDGTMKSVRGLCWAFWVLFGPFWASRAYFRASWEPVGLLSC